MGAHFDVVREAYVPRNRSRQAAQQSLDDMIAGTIQ